MTRKRLFVALATLAIAALAAAFTYWPPINDVATDSTPEYPDIRAQVFARPIKEVYKAAYDEALAMGWNVAGSEAHMRIEAVATTPILRFHDDVTIALSREAKGTRVAIRSRSRVGRADFGTNARRIRAYQHALANRLATQG